MARTITSEFSEPGKMIARGYIKEFLKDVVKFSREEIDYARHRECLGHFNANISKMKSLDSKGVIQGENEIDLAVKMYNLMNAQFGRN